MCTIFKLQKSTVYYRYIVDQPSTLMQLLWAKYEVTPNIIFPLYRIQQRRSEIWENFPKRSTRGCKCCPTQHFEKYSQFTGVCCSISSLFSFFSLLRHRSLPLCISLIAKLCLLASCPLASYVRSLLRPFRLLPFYVLVYSLSQQTTITFY